MKTILYLSTFILLIACTSQPKEQESTAMEDHSQHAMSAAADTTKKSKSPKSMAMTMLGDNHIHIDYSAPSMRGRQVFGGLVAYGEVWVTGAHKATSITFDKDVIINGQPLTKGKYGLFTIPGVDNWTVIFNKTWDMHLADDYNPEEDALRIEVASQKLAEPVETLVYKIEATDNTATVSVAWADMMVAFDIINAN
jgi:hypothetical protein